MDKASIVGDAVLYVQELQSQAKKLKSDIAGLEASLNTTGGYQEPALDAQKTQTFRGINPLVSKKIIQVVILFLIILIHQKHETLCVKVCVFFLCLVGCYTSGGERVLCEIDV